VLFAILAEDKPNSASLRAATRPTHLEYLASFGTKVVIAGPLLGSDNETVTGSLLIFDATDRTGAEAFAAGDPYAKAGLFTRTTISPWRKVVFNAPQA
jgi:uncharacterized protein